MSDVLITEKIIAQGSFGTVRLGTKNSKKVAVKCVKLKYSNVANQEIKILSSLNHEAVITLIEYGKTEEFIYLCFELYLFDLEQYIEIHGSLTLFTARTVFGQITSAVDYIHNMGIYHRDIKPQNIVINEKLTVKLIDFGSATNNKYSHGVFGTHPFSSPEASLSSSQKCSTGCNYCYSNAENDLWALGVLLYFIMYAKSPFIIMYQQRPISELIIKKLLCRNPHERWKFPKLYKWLQ